MRSAPAAVRVATLAAGALLAFACGDRPYETPRVDPVRPAASAVASAAPSASAPPMSLLEVALRARDREPPGYPQFVPKDGAAFAFWVKERREEAMLRDPLGLALVRDAPTYSPWNRAASSQAAFTMREGLSARGFAYRYAWLTERGRKDRPECEGENPRVIANDGTLCPTVVNDGALLTPDQLRRLLALIRAPGPVTERWRCGYQPHHAFVIFDENDAPIAQIGACFTCGEWRTEPPIAGADPAMGKTLNDGLTLICRELGLGGCGHGLEMSARVRNVRIDSWQHQESHGDLSGERPYPLPDSPSGVDPDKRLYELADHEKRRLCAYHVRRLGERGPGKAGDATLCSDTKTLRVLDFTSCVEGFPKCDQRVYEAEACVRATNLSVCEPQDCEERCLVGIAR